MWIEQITLPQGQTRRVPSEEVGEEAFPLLVPWVQRLIESDGPLALPVAEVAHFSASGLLDAGGLVVTIYAPDRRPLATFGVAGESRRAPMLWSNLCDCLGTLTCLPMPQQPWYAITNHAHREWSRSDGPARWLGPFALCVAGCWIGRAAQALPQVEMAEA